MIDKNEFIEESKRIFNTLTDKVSGYASAGKQKLDVMSLEAELSKAQRQLGALVYSLKKTNQEDEALTKQYMDTIDDIYDKIEHAKTLSQPITSQTRHCSGCTERLSNSDIFCPRCGQRQG